MLELIRFVDGAVVAAYCSAAHGFLNYYYKVIDKKSQ